MPLVLLSDWAIALTKLWILFHPAKQSWLNRGARSLDSTLRSQQYRFKAGLAHYLYVFTCVTAIVILGLASGLFPILREARLFFGDTGAASSTTFERLSSEATVGMETARSAGDLRPRWVTTATHRPVSLKEQEHFLLFSSEMHIGSKSHEN